MNSYKTIIYCKTSLIAVNLYPAFYIPGILGILFNFEFL